MIPHNVALSVDETDQMSDLLAAKYIISVDELTPTVTEATCALLAVRLARHIYEQRNLRVRDENLPLRDQCRLCDGTLLEDRVRVDKRNHVVVPCWSCRPRAFCAYHAMIARHEESQEAAAGPAEGRSAGLPLPTGPGMPADNRTTPLRRDPSPRGTPAAASCDSSDDAPATLRTACNWCGSTECQAPVEHMVQLCGSDARWSLECAACHKCLTGGASYVALGVFAEHHEAHGLACRWASPEFHSNRDGWDERDDKSDLQPFESTTTYPWWRHGDD